MHVPPSDVSLWPRCACAAPSQVFADEAYWCYSCYNKREREAYHPVVCAEVLLPPSVLREGEETLVGGGRNCLTTSLGPLVNMTAENAETVFSSWPHPFVGVDLLRFGPARRLGVRVTDQRVPADRLGHSCSACGFYEAKGA